MEIVKAFLTKNDCYQYNEKKIDNRYVTFQKRGPLGLMIHSVGCAQPDATVFINSWNKPNVTKSVHAFIDANSGTVMQTMPWNYRAWHCGGSGNNTHVGVEMCESGYIRYIPKSNKFEILNADKAKADCRRAYRSAVELFAMLCTKYKLNPLTCICSHKEGNRSGIATDHGDPEHYWLGLGMGYTMNGFRADVKKTMEDYLDMTKDEVAKLIEDAVKPLKEKIAEQQKTIDSGLGGFIRDIHDVPESLRGEVRRLLDCGAVNGGTTAEENPDDLNMYYQDLRVAVINARYADYINEHTSCMINIEK